MVVKRILKHYGTPRRSGRYPWGSGEDPYQDNASFLGYVKSLQDKGMSETEIAKSLKMSTTQLRAARSIARNEKRAADAAMAGRLKDKGMSNTAIGRKMGINESSVRSLLKPELSDRANITQTTANVLKDGIANKKYIDVGVGVEHHLGISRTKLNTAVTQLVEKEGYTIHYIQVEQVGTGKFTSIKVLAPPGTPYVEVSKNREQIGLVHDYSEDGGRTYRTIEPINSIDRSRIMVRYGEEGAAKDGTLELRKGVADISLGDDAYAQVRVGVDGTHYMKGMAFYGQRLPKGVDIIYNTNKDRTGDRYAAFKEIEVDPENPFGTTIRQRYYLDANGREHLSTLNIVGNTPGSGVEGAWDKWNRNISSQILSKQTPKLAESQLGLALKIRQEEFDEIMALTNPSVKKALLRSFADGADASSVDLKAAALPRQASQVLLPVNSLKDNEVFAPNFRNGEQVVLIRHPHGGIFEIPELQVNNRNPDAIKIIGKDALDAVGVNSKVANRLSGADFDGDTVIVIPNNKRLIKTSPSLKALKDFDPKTAYPKFDGMKRMDNPTKQKEMGKVSNLITDMTIKGASQDEIARAVRHSMVVIDAEKHNLNYRQSFKDNGISALKAKYQGGPTSGASTIISRSGSKIRVDERTEGEYRTDKQGKRRKVYVDPRTGRKLYTDTGVTYTTKDGRIVKKQSKSKRMLEETDARKLSSGTVMEEIYASHANSLKALANKARRTVLKTKDIAYSSTARSTFKKEVDALKAKLREAYRNKPLERKAQTLAQEAIKRKRMAKPDLTPSQLKKLKGQELDRARAAIGAKKANVEITDREWLAIQAGAVSPSALNNILLNTDVDALKVRAMPRTRKGLSVARINRAKSMSKSGYTNAEIADALGVSRSVVTTALEDE